MWKLSDNSQTGCRCSSNVGTCEPHWKSVYPGPLMKEARIRAGSLRWSWMALWNSTTLRLEWSMEQHKRWLRRKISHLLCGCEVLSWLIGFNLFLWTRGIQYGTHDSKFFLIEVSGQLSRTFYERCRVKVTARGNVLVGRYSSTLSVERLRLKEIEPTGLQYSDQQYLHTQLYCWICLHRFNHPIVPPSSRARRVLPMSTLTETSK